MKRTLSILMALALALACAMTAGAEGLSGTIRYSTWGSIAEKEVNEKIIAAFMEAVSYTHLDVYKRQILGRGQRPRAQLAALRHGRREQALV